MKRETTMLEGFWHSPSQPELPKPKPDQWEGAERRRFTLALMWIQNSVAEKTRYRGLSRCRICHQPNGCDEYSALDYRWPGGLMHYIEVHGVKPGRAFREAIAAEHEKHATIVTPSLEDAKASRRETRARLRAGRPSTRSKGKNTSIRRVR